MEDGNGHTPGVYPRHPHRQAVVPVFCGFVDHSPSTTEDGVGVWHGRLGSLRDHIKTPLHASWAQGHASASVILYDPRVWRCAGSAHVVRGEYPVQLLSLVQTGAPARPSSERRPHSTTDGVRMARMTACFVAAHSVDIITARTCGGVTTSDEMASLIATLYRTAKRSPAAGVVLVGDLTGLPSRVALPGPTGEHAFVRPSKLTVLWNPIYIYIYISAKSLRTTAWRAGVSLVVGKNGPWAERVYVAGSAVVEAEETLAMPPSHATTVSAKDRLWEDRRPFVSTVRWQTLA